MKIVIGTTRPFHLFHLARELFNIGHDVELHSYMPSIIKDRYSPGLVKYKSAFHRLPIKCALALQSRNLSIQEWATNKLLSNMDKIICESMSKCDVYVGLSGMCVDSLKVAKSLGAVAICDRGSTHVLNQKRALENSNNSSLRAEYVQRELAGYSEADYIAVPSIYSMRTFLDEGIGRDKIILNNYGVDLNRFPPKSHKASKNAQSRSSDVCSIVFVGAWCYRKGCDILCELLENHNDIQITHVGLPGDVQFPNSNRFKTIGHVPNSRLHDVYQDHDLMILPSREDGFGMVLLEALACGIPIVASVNCGAPDIQCAISNGNEAVYIFEGQDQNVIYRSIKLAKLKAMNDVGVSISDNDRRYYSWSSYGKRYSDFLEKIVSAA